MKIVDETNGKLDEIKEFAAKINMADNLSQRLDRLAQIADNNEANLFLYSDFAPQSMYFQIAKGEPPFSRADLVLNGGLIYHGSHDGYGSGAAPTLSVTIERTDGWGIHT